MMSIMKTTNSYQTVNVTLPQADIRFLRSFSKKMGWNVRVKRMTGIEKGLEDIRTGNVFHAKDSQDLIQQILG